MGIKIDDLSDAIMKELNEYQQDVTDGLKKEVEVVAKECVRELKKNSPKDGGDYAKSWGLKKVYESREDIRIRVYSRSPHYRLAHLLEHGHAGPGGTSKGSAAPIPHISIAERNASNKLFNKVKVVVKG